MFSVKIVWLQEVVTERDKICKLFTNQIVKNAQELTTYSNTIKVALRESLKQHTSTESARHFNHTYYACNKNKLI